MKVDRRTLLKALGLGAMSGALGPFGRRALAASGTPPLRIVFFIQPHAHVPSAWNMPIPDASSEHFAERSLADMGSDELSEVLRPLYAFRKRMLVIEGLSHSTVLADIAHVMATSGDANNHQIAVAGLLTGSHALQREGVPCSGGSRSLDQELALRTAGVGRFGSRVYGTNYVPNSTISPFSFLGPGQPTPVVSDPATAFADLMGYYSGPAHSELTREDKLRALRGSVLDSVAEEYEALAPRLDTEGRKKLDAHRDLVRDLEKSLGAGISASCELSLDVTEHKVRQFMQLVRLAFACDLTRVVTYVAPVPEAPEFGYPADVRVHGSYAHASIKGDTACGQAYSPLAERAMTDLGVWYAEHFARLLEGLDAVVEGSGTLLDHTLVVWLTELGTPTHQHYDVFSLVVGGSYFKTGRYLRYPRTNPNPIAGFADMGPSQTRLFVSLMQALGQSDQVFGMAEAESASGVKLSFKGPLAELRG